VRVGALFDEYASMVLAICRCILRDPQAAEDAAQETFLSAHRSLLGGTRPRDPAAWLATIARNASLRMRSTTRTTPLDEGTTGTLLDPADIVADRADLADVASAIAGLPARQREALVLREFYGLSYDQVATAMSVSGAAVDSLLSRARRRLFEQVGDIPRAARGALVVPASLREDLARLIPGLDQAGAAAGVASGAGGGAAALASLGSAPLAAKAAATGAAAVALALPMQATVRVDGEQRAGGRPQAAAPAGKRDGARPLPARAPAPVAPVAAAFEAPAPRHVVRASTHDRRGPSPTEADDHENREGPGGEDVRSGSSGPGSGSSGSGSSGAESGGGDSGSGGQSAGSSGSGSSGPGSSSSGSGGSGTDSGGSDTGSSGPGSSGPGSSGHGSSSSGSGSGSSASSSSGSGSSGSSGSGSSGSDSDPTTSSGSDSGSSDSGSSDSSGSDSSGSDSGGSGSEDSASDESASDGSSSDGSGSDDGSSG
jgi:RNA polymerase sigma factor (sigma-70 family)